MDQNKILDKLRKLKALADSPSATQAEAELALFRLNEIALKHGIEMSSVELSTLGGVMEGDYVVPGQKMKLKWIEQLALACAKMFDGHLIVNKKLHGTEFSFVGFPEDIPAMKYLFEYLYSSWKRIVEKDLNEAKRTRKFTPSNTMKFKHGHGFGFSSTINSRVNDMVDKRNRDIGDSSEGGRKLVLYKKSTVEDYLKGMKRNTVKISAGSELGRIMGNNAGSKINIGVSPDVTLRISGS